MNLSCSNSLFFCKQNTADVEIVCDIVLITFIKSEWVAAEFGSGTTRELAAISLGSIEGLDFRTHAVYIVCAKLSVLGYRIYGYTTSTRGPCYQVDVNELRGVHTYDIVDVVMSTAS